MRIEIKMVGSSPLLQHNIALADPGNSIVREIKAITSKRKKTDDDRAAIERLEWYGGLYSGENGPEIQAAAVKKCLINTGRINKLGKQVERAFHPTSMAVPLAYDGPRKIDELFKRPEFQHRAAVRVQTSVTIRVRPKFFPWSLVCGAELLEDMLDPDDLARIVALAGVVEGLGDGRNIGFGRFSGSLK